LTNQGISETQLTTFTIEGRYSVSGHNCLKMR